MPRLLSPLGFAKAAMSADALSEDAGGADLSCFDFGDDDDEVRGWAVRDGHTHVPTRKRTHTCTQAEPVVVPASGGSSRKTKTTSKKGGGDIGTPVVPAAGLVAEQQMTKGHRQVRSPTVESWPSTRDSCGRDSKCVVSAACHRRNRGCAPRPKRKSTLLGRCETWTLAFDIKNTCRRRCPLVPTASSEILNE